MTAVRQYDGDNAKMRQCDGGNQRRMAGRKRDARRRPLYKMGWWAQIETRQEKSRDWSFETNESVTWRRYLKPFQARKLKEDIRPTLSPNKAFSLLMKLISDSDETQPPSPFDIDINIPESSSNHIKNSTWDIDSALTKKILHDMGAEVLSQTSTDSCGSSETTPAITAYTENSQSSCSSFNLPPVPGAYMEGPLALSFQSLALPF
ncbi:hypothetical protein DPMN_064056 [Dreissena polymorpha]|uniref:Uncharacterized protein n=1 Tax=Dreissena polymorpha TaxID=45954 RepID=A0A9D4CCS1_DREPO|nr:hypothetical protein DPMN_064056 [Dreissena polymorpha]